MTNYLITSFFSLLFLLITNLSTWAGLPEDFLYLPPDEQIRILDINNRERDARVGLHDSASSLLYAEGLALLRLGQIENGFSKLEQAILKSVPEISTRYPLEFNDLTHRYFGIAYAVYGVKGPTKFFRALGDKYPNDPLVQAAFAFNALRLEGLETMGNGLRVIDKAFQKDPENRFARIAKALTLSWLPFGFHAADREWERLLSDASIPPEYKKMFLLFRRQMYTLHGHREKALAIPKHVPTGEFSAKLGSILGSQSLDDYRSFETLFNEGRKREALDHIERALRREIDKPGFALLFGRYLVGLERDNQRGARFFDRLATAYPSSPHALAAYGFYVHIVSGADMLRQGLEIIEAARKQTLQQPENLFVFDLTKAMHRASIPGQLAAALQDFDSLAPQYRSQVPYAAWVAENHSVFIRKAHGLLPSTLWANYNPWHSYVEEKDERLRGCGIYFSWK
jgi:tetratricopeptide (TPR) repeat protein